MRKVHDDIRAEQSLERIPLIHLSDKLKVGLPSTVAHTCCPIRPRAPTTPTLIITPPIG